MEKSKGPTKITVEYEVFGTDWPCPMAARSESGFLTPAQRLTCLQIELLATHKAIAEYSVHKGLGTPDEASKAATVVLGKVFSKALESVHHEREQSSEPDPTC